MHFNKTPLSSDMDNMSFLDCYTLRKNNVKYTHSSDMKHGEYILEDRVERWKGF